MRFAGWFLLPLLGCLALVAQTPELPPQPATFLSDQAGVVDAANRERIEQYTASLRNATGVEVAVLTIGSLQGQPIEDYANNVYRKWGIGQKTSNEGLLFVLAIEDRKTRMEVGYGLEPVLTDGFVGSIQRTVRPALRSGKYGDAILQALEAAGNKIRESKGQLSSTPGAAAYDGGTPWWVYLFASVFGICGIGVPVYTITQAFRSSSWSNQSARGRRAGGSGGVGGSASAWEGGGGFSSHSFSDSSSSSDSSSWSSSSSFSGGDSGGGGASSDW